MNDLYQEQIIDEAREPQQYGQMPDADLTFKGVNASCGDQLSIFLKFAKKGDKTSPITDLRWQGQGCVISQASMSMLAGKIISHKMTLAQLQTLNESDLEKMLGIPQVSIGRIKCLLLGLRTLQSNL